MAKKALITVMGVSAQCPECGEGLIDPHYGSYLLHIDEHVPADYFPCEYCGKDFQIPATVWSRRR